jgi:hypothetical protein
MCSADWVKRRLTGGRPLDVEITAEQRAKLLSLLADISSNQMELLSLISQSAIVAMTNDPETKVEEAQRFREDSKMVREAINNTFKEIANEFER